MKHWSPQHQAQIRAAIAHAKRDNPHPFAVFDADNTIWQHDLVESLFGWLSAKQLLQLADADPTILPYPPRQDDTLMSYYDHLCEVDHAVAYLFASQIFAGFKLGTLRKEIEQMMTSTTPIQAPMPHNCTKQLEIPTVFPGQRELIHFLQDEGVDVWIVSASLEELVRMVASDPQYGIQLPPERVIGVNLMLNKPDGGVTVGALERRDGLCGLDYYLSDDRMTWTLSTFPFSPLTWYGGKVAAILEWIDEAQRPILVAGDSPNDFYMQFHVAEGGVRLRIHRTETHRQALEQRQQIQAGGNLNPTPSAGWLEVTAQDLGL